MKILLTIICFLLSMCSVCAEIQMIKKENVKLDQIVSDTAYNLNKLISIKDYTQGAAIKKMAKHYNYGSEEDMSNVCIKAFIEWCDRFLGEKRDYIVLRLPSTIRADKNFEFWPKKDEKKTNPINVYENGENQIIFDPFIGQYRLNDFLLGNNVIVSACNVENLPLSMNIVIITSIIPYKRCYYKYEGSYYFMRKLRYEIFETKDIDTICEIVGERIIKDPSSLVDVEGWETVFVPHCFMWGLNSDEYKYIKKIDLNLTGEDITIKRLFLDNEMSKP